MKKIFLLVWTVVLLGGAPVWAAASWDYYRAGVNFYNQKQYGRAVQYFQAAIQADPNNWRAYQGLGLSYYAQADKADALEALDQSLAIHPDNPGLRKFADSLRGSSEAPPLPQASASNNSPVIGGGNFGLGLDFGSPGTWGATGKYWLDRENALQGAVKIDGTILELDYLWHDYDVIHPQSGAMPFYVGVGGGLGLNGAVDVALRVPVGLTYLFQKKALPMDIFVEAVPTLDFLYGVHFYLNADLGARYYF
jgi:tetratricopeptide (TPR) repeat protein